MQLLFSVIIPAYNCKEYLPAAVSHILNSGLWDYEILLIDDGSLDGTEQICDNLVAENECIHCIHQMNAGVSVARNRGIEKACGEYILFFDADDSVDPGALQNAAQVVLREKPDMLIYGMSFDYYFHKQLYRREKMVFPGEGIWDRAQWGAAFAELYRYNALSPVWNKMIRRDLLVEHQIRFRSDLIEMEDFVFSVQCLSCCDRIYLLPEAIYRYRQAENERNTYNRLCRINSLSEYMVPFMACVESLERSMKVQELENHNMKAVVGQIYSSFFYEQIRFASPDRIGEAAQDMLDGSFAEVIAAENPKLFNQLKESRYYSVWLHNGISRIRHWMAVRAKYLLGYRR